MKPFGRGLMQSLRARVDEDVLDLAKGNPALRRYGYGREMRWLRALIARRTVWGWFANYVFILVLLLAAEWLGTRFFPSWLASFTEGSEGDFLRDAAGFFITAQVGLLAVLSVAVSVVTLLSEKDDDPSNTQARFYYTASFANEFATSGIALLIVVIIQLFWPLQQIIHQVPGFVREAMLKYLVTAAHAIWLTLNCALFLHFLKTTFDFLVEENRAELRKRYVASEIIPHDVGRRLLALYYMAVPDQILGASEVKAGPLIRFGLDLDGLGDAETELTYRFRQPNRLGDIWMLPLGIALRSWFSRTRQLQGKADRRLGDDQWNGELAVPHEFRQVMDGRIKFLLRAGGAPVTRLERVLLWISFRFARVGRREQTPMKPKEFIESLIAKMVGSIASDAPTAFDYYLRETTDFHSFLLEAHNTRDEQGGKINLAQLQDGWFSLPDQEWVGAYRRVFVAAARKLSTDPYFSSGLSRVPMMLWPKEPWAYPPSVLRTILELGRYQVVTLEDWFAKQARATRGDEQAESLPVSSDRATYDGVVVQFVNSWESLQQVIVSSFDLESSARDGDEAYWAASRASWPSLQIHLRNAAFFLVAAVWNDDASGSERYRDLMLRWLECFYRELQQEFPFRDSAILTPNLMDATLPEAQTAPTRILLYAVDIIKTRSIFGAVLREAHNDVVCITGALLLYWHATRRQASDTAARAGLLTLRRSPMAGGGGSLLQPGGRELKPIFRLVFDVLVRNALESRFNESSHSAYLEGLIRVLNDLSAPRTVPGRIYSGVGLDGFDTLTPEFLAIMVANLPPTHAELDDAGTRRRGRAEEDYGAAEFMDRVLATEPVLQVDRQLSNFAFTFGQDARKLDGVADERFRTTAELFGPMPDLEARRARLKAIFEGVVTAIEAKRSRRIREAPIDQSKMERVRADVTAALAATTQPVGVFAPLLVRVTDRTNIPEKEDTFGVLERGQFTDPEMSLASFEEIPGLIVMAAQTSVTNVIWQQLGNRTRIEVPVPGRDDVRAFYTRAIQVAEANEEIGQELVLMVPNEPFATPVYMTTSGFPDPALTGFTVTRHSDMQKVPGTFYAGTMNGIQVFGWPFTEVAVICSRTLLREIDYGRVHGGECIFEFELYDHGDPSQSRVRYWLAPELTWENRPIVWFQFSQPESGSRPRRRTQPRAAD